MRTLAIAVLLTAACSAPPGLNPTGHVHGHVSVSPCTPVERFPPSPCPPAAGVKIAFGNTAVVATDAAGDYDVRLPPGDYQVVVNAGVARRPKLIHVNSGDDLTLDLDVDSGIR